MFGDERMKNAHNHINAYAYQYDSVYLRRRLGWIWRPISCIDIDWLKNFTMLNFSNNLELTYSGDRSNYEEKARKEAPVFIMGIKQCTATEKDE